ncbi:hypothetical protein CEG14_05505 [Bordetella genomosp. 1]|uniref:Uncharacterized protein n=1 Tax=Bordetella genomosp. 1 TaxID=1395607 RepID=A0A261STB1_9BORD|nr:hypothetical protein CEG14_05505 [Bordetella genomosp. 1]
MLLAAKAAGLEVWPGTGFQAHQLFRRPDTADPSGKVSGVEWNPRGDDGDNRRLQVRLRLGLVPLDGGGWDCVIWDHDEEVTLATSLDPNQAVVSAAAEIGAKMQEGQRHG